MPETKQTKAPAMADADITIVRIAPETSFKNKAYEALKEAILKMDIYATPEQVMLDERALSERLGVSRTPIREAIWSFLKPSSARTSSVCSPSSGERFTSDGLSDILIGLPTERYLPRVG